MCHTFVSNGVGLTQFKVFLLQWKIFMQQNHYGQLYWSFFTDIGRVRMVRFGMEFFSANVHRYKYECCKLRQTTCDSIHRASETEGVAL